MSGFRWRHTILLSLLTWSAMIAAARAEVTPADHALVDQVAHRLLAVAKPVAGYAWPPTIEVDDKEDENAHACNDSKDERDQVRPKIVVNAGLLHRVVQGNANRLAFILGHELGHVVLKHIEQVPCSGSSGRTGEVRTDVVNLVFGREQEIAADAKGMELTLAADYSFKGALGAIRRFIDLDLEYSSFEGLGVNHPSWKDRIALLDKEQAPLWHAMAAFHDGTYFLITEQYGSAERCFRAVTREFPACHEAWANLGYALLMRYCDGLEVDDLRRFDLGQLAVGGFYRRPGTLEAQIRGIDEELWWDAVGALREALRLKPDSVLIKANLGVAYLVRPAGRDVGQAARYLQEAAEAVESDPANAGLNDPEKVNLRERCCSTPRWPTWPAAGLTSARGGGTGWRRWAPNSPATARSGPGPRGWWPPCITTGRYCWRPPPRWRSGVPLSASSSGTCGQPARRRPGGPWPTSGTPSCAASWTWRPKARSN